MTAARTFSTVAAETLPSLPLMTLDTVMALTPASRATSRSVAMSFLPGPAAVLTILQTEVYR